jgi:signal transduction histidine kinase
VKLPGNAVIFRVQAGTEPPGLGFPVPGPGPDGAGGIRAQQAPPSKGIVRSQRYVPFANAKAKLDAAVNSERANERERLLLWSGLALGLMAVVSAVLGWLMAGRALAPVRTMTARARKITEENLHERLALAGSDDELKELADTFDGVLDRLQGAFEAQRRFVANASHELRTPLTLGRTTIEVALADPNADASSLRRACEAVLAAGEQQERLISGLLTLARSNRGLELAEPLDLRDTVDAALEGLESSAAPVARGLRIESDLTPAPLDGDPRLIERLVANLLDNAVRHNVEDGWLSVATSTEDDGRATLTVANGGAPIAPEDVPRLLEPFRRGGVDRTTRADGYGLGLSIVAAIADAHGAGLHATPLPDGGLEVVVSFPAAHDPAPTTTATASATAVQG